MKSHGGSSKVIRMLLKYWKTISRWRRISTFWVSRMLWRILKRKLKKTKKVLTLTATSSSYTGLSVAENLIY